MNSVAKKIRCSGRLRRLAIVGGAILFVCLSCQSTVWAQIAGDQYVVVVVDDSGSMDDRMRTDDGRVTRMKAAKAALKKVVGMLPEDTEMGILLLNGARNNGHWLEELGPLNRQSAEASIDQIGSRGGTKLGAAMEVGFTRLLEARQAKGTGTFRLLVITDGEANDQGYLDRLLPDMLSRGILIDVIGVDMDQDHALSTKAHSYRRADDAASFNEAVAAVFAESSSDDPDGGESDFEMLAGIPDEMAQRVLATIATPNNEPLQVAEKAPFSFSSGGGGNGVVRFFGFAGVFCFGVFIFIFMVIATVFSKKKRRR
jgi:hypothetical protein